MARFVWLLAVVAVASLALGCGDDDAGPVDAGAGDAGLPACPATAPDLENMMGTCCYRRNNADQLDAPELRIAAFSVRAPRTIANDVVNGVLRNGLDTELFNWILRAEISGTTATMTTGYGVRSCIPAMGATCDGDSTFAFDIGGMFPPATIMGDVDGDNITAPRQMGIVDVPVFEEDGVTLQLSLPLNNLSITEGMLTEDRSCVGVRRPGQYATSSGELTAFITVADAMGAPLVIGTTLDTTLCMLIAGMGDMAGVTCADVPQSSWMGQPDAICMGDPSTCMEDPGDGSVCDPATTCNAWFVRAEFAAHGVEITN